MAERNCPCGDETCHLDRESKMRLVGTDGDKPVWCDPCIAELVKALNDAGLKTIASCCGHGFRPGNIILADGREIVIARSFNEGRAIDRLFPVDINGERMSTKHLVTDEMADAALFKSRDKRLDYLTNTNAMREIVAAALAVSSPVDGAKRDD